MKIDVIDEDGDDEFDFVDHYEYQYSTRDLRREIDTAPKSLVLSGSRTRFVSLYYCFSHTLKKISNSSIKGSVITRTAARSAETVLNKQCRKMNN